MKNFPSISIVTLAYNVNLKIFKQSLESIKNQKYPRDRIEQIVVDGGSTNGTVRLAKSYGCIVMERSDLEYETEMRKSLGIKKKAKEYMLFREKTPKERN